MIPLFKKPRIIFLFLFVLIIFIFLVRTVGLLSNNALFIFDGSRDFLYVQKIAVDHKPILIGPASGGLQGYFHGVIWYYILAIPFVLSGGHPISGPWFMAIASTLSVLAAFFILKKIMNIYSGIVGILLLGLGGYSVATAKFIWNPYPIVWLMPIYFLGIYLLVRRYYWGIFIISTTQGLLLHFEIIYGLGTLPAYMFLLIFFLTKTKKNDKLKHIFIALILFCFPLIPSMIFDLRHQFIISKSVLATITTGGENISHKTGESPNNILERLSLRTKDVFKYSVRSATSNEYLNYALFCLLIIVIIAMAKTKNNRENIIIVAFTTSIFLSTFCVFLLLKYNVWGYYWIGNAPLYAMLLSFCIGYFVKRYRQFILFGAISGLLFLIAKPWSVIPYWHNGDLKSGPQTLSTQLTVVDAIYRDAKGQPFSVYQQTPPVYDYVYRYLFSWKGLRKYNFIPIDKKQKIVYVILEGVPQDLKATYFKTHTLHLSTKPVRTFRFGNTWPIVEKFITSPTEKPVDPNFFPQI